MTVSTTRLNDTKDPEARKMQRKKWTGRRTCSALTGMPWARFIMIKSSDARYRGNCQMGHCSRSWRDRLRRAQWVQPFSSGVKFEDPAKTKKNNLKHSRVLFGITGQKRRELHKKTLADLRATCKMKPILDLTGENCPRRLHGPRTHIRFWQDRSEEYSQESVQETTHGSFTSGSRIFAGHLARKMRETRCG